MGQKVSRQATVKSLNAVASYLEQQAEELRQELTAVETELRDVRSAIEITHRIDDSVFRARKRAGTYESELTEAIVAELQKEQPLHREDLLHRVEEAGVHIGGQHPLDNMATYLTRDPRCTSVGSGYWALVG